MSNSSLRFFMSSLGNTDLLERHLVAFFASRSVTPEAESRCIAWAESICNTDSVVISGFHSPLEKKVLNILLEHKHPVVLFLGRAMYKRIPAEYQEAIDEGRMLIDTIRDFERHSWNSAQTKIGMLQVSLMRYISHHLMRRASFRQCITTSIDTAMVM